MHTRNTTLTGERLPDRAVAADVAADARNLLLVAGHIKSVNAAFHQVRRLCESGYAVCVAFRHGHPGPRLLKLVDAHRLRGLGAGQGPESPPSSYPDILLDSRFEEALAECDVVLAMDPDAEAALRRHPSGPQPRLGPDEARDLLAVRVLARDFEAATQAVPAQVSAPGSRASLVSVEWLSGRPWAHRFTAPQVLGLAIRLVRAGRRSVAAAIAKEAVTFPGAELVEPGLRALSASAELTEEGSTDADVVALAAETLQAADAALGAGQQERVTTLVSLALGLAFHRELHVDVPRTPLVDEPETFLAPLYRSRVMQLLHSGMTSPQPEASGTGRVVVLPGAYSRFSHGVVTALESGPDATVRVLDLSGSDPTYRNVAMDPAVVDRRLRHARGEEVPVVLEHLEELEAADVVFADWCDKGAVWASMFTPPGRRLVVRVHSVDALTPWPLLVDWSRVTDLIFVAEHIRDLVVEMLGDRIRHIRLHVVPNVIDDERFVTTKAPGAHRTLGLVGWAQRVKDPLWAVEVLARLLRHHPDWRLRLIGNDFATADIASSRDYVRAFRERVVQDDVRDHIDYIGYTDNLPQHLEGVGYALSSSMREAAPVGVTEAAASGAVPVVRDWPVFARRCGAARQFPPDWVVQDVAQAADRILAVDRDGWEAARQRTLAEVRARYGTGDVAGLYRQIVLEPVSAGPAALIDSVP